MGIKEYKMSQSVGRFLAYIRSISFSWAILSDSLKPLSHFLPLLLPNFMSELSTLIVHFFNVSSFSIYCNWASWPSVVQTNYLPKLPVFFSFSCVPFFHLSPSSLPLSSRRWSLALLLATPSLSFSQQLWFSCLQKITVPQASTPSSFSLFTTNFVSFYTFR